VTSKASGLALVAVVVLAMGMAGTRAVEFHKDCLDGIDNDGSGDFDFFEECLAYPYADGNGEQYTPVDERFNSIAAAYVSPNGFANAFEYNVWFYDNVPSSYCLPPGSPPCILGAIPTFCTQPIPGVFLHSFAHFPASEGSEASFQALLTTCPP